MVNALLGKKIKMSQIFNDDGTMIPVTIVKVGPCSVVQIKTIDRDGYNAVKLGFENIKESKCNKPELGLFKKNNLQPLKYLKEVKCDINDVAIGQTINVSDVFTDCKSVDVTGISKGHGFCGVIKRWNFHRLKETHGTGPVHRQVGSVGARHVPGRVFKGKKMPGHYGNEQITVLNLKLVKIDNTNNLIYIKGAIPGNKNSVVCIRKTIKK